MRRAGFSLIEMMIAVTLVAVVTGELAVMMAGLFQLQRRRMWNAELQNKLRVAREQILFLAGARADGKSYGGLIGASNVVWQGAQLWANFQQAEKGLPASYDPTPMNLQKRFVITGIDDGENAITGENVTNDLFFVSTEVMVGGRTRSERLAVPAFGRYGTSLWGEFMEVTPGDITYLP